MSVDQDVLRTEHYVTMADWRAPRGRRDLLDSVADEFERRPRGSGPQDGFAASRLARPPSHR